MTGRPVFSANPAGEARSAPIAGDADNARVPADPGPDQKAVFGGNIFEHLAKLGAQPLGGQTRRIVQKLIEPRSMQGANPELGQNFLLPDALVQSAHGQVWRFARRLLFHDWQNWLIGGRHRIGYAAYASGGSLVRANLRRRGRVRQSIRNRGRAVRHRPRRARTYQAWRSRQDPETPITGKRPARSQPCCGVSSCSAMIGMGTPIGRGSLHRVARRLALGLLSFGLIGRKEGFGGRPVALGPALGAAFLEPKEIGNLANAIVAISHGRPRSRRGARAVALARNGGLFGRCRSARRRSRSRGRAADPPALVRGGMARRLASARPAGAFSAAVVLVDRRPSPTFGLLLGIPRLS